MPVLMEVLYGPYRNQRIVMPDDDATQAVADGWAYDPSQPRPDPPFDLTVQANADRVYEAACIGAAKLRGEGPPPPPLVVSSLAPAQATIGDPDLEMHVIGEGFTTICIINFNGGDEPTTFISDTELSTIVKPSTATVAGAVPVTVKRGEEESAPLDFTFIDPVRSRATRDAYFREAKHER
jgi:hypothetical protein